MISFHVLGAGGAVPTVTHSPAGHLVRIDGEPHFVDPGPGALVSLVKAEILPGGIDAIETVLLSHLHPDHCLDLVALLFALHSPIPSGTGPLRLFGPTGLENLLDMPLKLGRLRHIVFGDKVDTLEFETVYSLFEFIDGVV